MLKVFTSFSGYDSQCLALRRLNIDFDLVGWSEIDRFAIQAHNALFPEFADRNFGDICKIDWLTVPDFDLFTYSSPCQDFSAAGRQKGGDKGSGTRSSLLWECEKAISIKRPNILVMENVSALVSRKFIKLFNRWQNILENYGYKNFARILNAKNYGIPQNRKRIFLISILNGVQFYFPEPVKLERRLKDVLEKNIDKKYYLSKSTIDVFKVHKEKHNVKEPILPQILTKARTEFGKSIRKEYESGKIKIKRKNIQQLEPRKDGISNTLTSVKTDNLVCEPIIVASRGRQSEPINAPKFDNFKIRKLTPRECFRLMGLLENEIDIIQNAGISNSQQYKLAGNSIVVNVLCELFRKIYIDKKNENKQLQLF